MKCPKCEDDAFVSARAKEIEDATQRLLVSFNNQCFGGAAVDGRDDDWVDAVGGLRCHCDDLSTAEPILEYYDESNAYAVADGEAFVGNLYRIRCFCCDRDTGKWRTRQQVKWAWDSLCVEGRTRVTQQDAAHINRLPGGAYAPKAKEAACKECETLKKAWSEQFHKRVDDVKYRDELQATILAFEKEAKQAIALLGSLTHLAPSIAQLREAQGIIHNLMKLVRFGKL